MNKKTNLKIWRVMMFLVLGIYCTTAVGDIIYVGTNAPPSGDGLTWLTAYKYLQDGLADANSNPDVNEIWVAQGTYTPDSNTADPCGTGNRESTFQLINGVALYGGYAGYGAPDPNARDIQLYETILSGDLNGNDVDVNNPCDLTTEPTRGENSYHVVTGSGTDANAILDGFTITGGNADSSSQAEHQDGAGMFNEGGSPTVSYCTFKANSTYYFGAGIYNDSCSSPELISCNFTANSALSGAGIHNNDHSCPTLTDCNFSGNAAKHDGGAMFNKSHSSPVLINCIFTGNWGYWRGGAIYNNVFSSPIMTSCTFTQNWSDEGGGVLNWNYSDPVLTGCTFIENTATSYIGGGGLSNRFTSSPTLTDCNFIRNLSEGGGAGMYNEQYSNPTVINCIFNENSTDAATKGGAGIYNYYSSPTVINCAFIGNSASFYGGGIFAKHESPTVTNCTFTGNSASAGGGIYNKDTTTFTIANCTITDNIGGGIGNWDASPTIINCIIWNNSPHQIHNLFGSFSVSYCDVEGGWPGLGNIDADPCFVDANGPDGTIGTEDDNLRLMPDSPCIDAGDNNSVPEDANDLDGDGNTVEPIPWDLDGRDRFADGDCNDTEIVDMGAYEFTYAYYGDFDGECDVDFVDYAILANYWLTDEFLVDIAPTPAGDGIVDDRDLDVLCDNWLTGK